MLREFFRPTVSLWGLCHCAGSLAGLCTLAGFGGSLGWLFDLSSHFRPQYGVGLALLALLCLVGKKFKPAAVYGSLALVNLAVIGNCLHGERHLPKPGQVSLRVVLLNVQTANERYDLVRRFLLESRPDVIALLEVDERWLKELAALRPGFPHQSAVPRDDNFGLALLSRWPLRDARALFLGEAEVPSIVAQVAVDRRLVTVLATHPLPPGSPQNARLRDEQLTDVAEFLAGQSGPVVLLGDLNATPWSSPFQRLVRESGLRDSSRGLGLHPTWPSHLWPLRVPIDHCLVSRDMDVTAKTVGPAVGSDHLPLVVDLRF